MQSEIVITLTPDEICLAEKIAIEQDESGKMLKLREADRGTYPILMRVKGRIAFLRALNIPCILKTNDGISRRETIKINNFYLRTRGKSSYDLVIDPCDRDEDKIALLTTDDGITFTIHGWTEVSRGRALNRVRYFPSTKTTVPLVPKGYLHKFEVTNGTSL